VGFVFLIECNYFFSSTDAGASAFTESTATAAESTLTESTATTVESELTSVDFPLPQDDNTAIDAIAKIANTFFMLFFLCLFINRL
jgi:hypothetical protein